jgi:hypothetical protein
MCSRAEMNKKGRAKGCTAQRKEGSYANARLLLSQALPIEQVLLTLNAPRVTRGRSVKAYYAVTGYCDRQVILGARTRYRPNRLRPSDTLRDFGKRNRLAYRNLPQSSPHPLLEGCAADIERQVQTDFRVLNEGNDSRQATKMALSMDCPTANLISACGPPALLRWHHAR